jgi:hypothetical protein
MQACLENTDQMDQTLLESDSLPLVESTSLRKKLSLPLPQSTSQRMADAPTWTIRVARPTTANRNELAKELLEVPKAALRQVFGKVLGTRLWQQNRAAAKQPPVNTKAAPVAPISPIAPVADSEISSGMLRYLCAEAAATLREHQRFAKSIGLTVQYSDGESQTVQQALPQTAHDAASLEAASRLALRRMRSHIFVSLKLDVTVTMVAGAAPTAKPAATMAPLTRVA